MNRVISADGTSIAYVKAGTGPTIVLVGGGVSDRSENAPVQAELSAHFTVYNYDRRGRGESTDTLPYAVTREIEDLAAIIDVAGGSAHLYGASSGGALALEAAAGGLPIESVAVYEVPYSVGDEALRHWANYVQDLNAALAAGRRDTAFELFMRVAGSPEEEIAAVRELPVWPSLQAVAHTLAYDAACLGDGSPPASRFAKVTQPVLVTTGGAGGDFFESAADALAATLPHAQREVIPGQGHEADAALLSPRLTNFFRAAQAER